MLRQVSLCNVLLPILGFVAYPWSVQLLGSSRHNLMFAENGIVELGTAAFFLFASGMAVRLALKTGRDLPQRYRVLFLLYGVAACFVALEEMSYGQHIFGWKPPAFFEHHSTKCELNLHNLYHDWLSNMLRDVANASFPLCFIVLPVVCMRSRGCYSPGHWSYYLLPKKELIVVVLLAQALSPLDKLTKWFVGGTMLVRSGEVQELYWSVAAAIYVCVIEQRLVSGVDEAVVLPFRPIQVIQARMRKAA